MRYGTKIIIGAETQRLATKQIHIRELDDLPVKGYGSELQIYELLGLVSDGLARPNWLSLYEAGLDACRVPAYDRCNLLLKGQRS